ncbi:MAG: RNA-splicing ligase RtcB [Candidatus Verstraetearchaeota archaeon]|nr:RNA-splicing ligase RtcB [Candidatus Verstraetearchaeota archaeon]
MNVPGRVYADESLLQKMSEDLTLTQCVNVAQLPGILKFSITMPDGHQGYGFPIGGVAAFDSETGVISPGGVGYDINCLPVGSKVLTPDGYRVPIEQAMQHKSVSCIDSGKAVPAMVALGLKKRDGPLYKIVTKSGLTIKATGDHPILTAEGMVEAKSLRNGVRVATHPFQGVDFESPPPVEILRENDFIPNISKALVRREILPLRAGNRRLAAILRLLGYFLGDGSFDGKKTCFYGSKEGMAQLRRDVAILGFSPSRVYTRERSASINGKGFISIENSVHVSARSFRQLMERLGAPKGNKTADAFVVPEWIMILPKWLQRSFLAGYFGAEMNKPQTPNGYNLEPPVASCTKSKPSTESGIKFLSQLGDMLKGFGVEVCGIYQEDLGDRVRLKLQLSEKPESLINLWSKIGYTYSPKKQGLALAAVSWLRWKVSVISERQRVAVATKASHTSGSSIREILESTGDCRWINRRFIERSVCEDRLTSPRGFPPFENWAAASLEGDIVWDEVVETTEERYFGEVYDITVDNPSHNFVAEGFIVSNCGVRLVLTNLEVKDVRPNLSKLVDTLFDLVPSGLGSKGGIRLDTAQQDQVLDRGVEWAVEKGYGWEEDARRCEEGGRMKTADHTKVSPHAKGRGASQLGTLGSGNHFLEVQVVDKIYEPHTAKIFGVENEGQVVVMIHSGSRGLGHQVCSDYLHVMEHAVSKYKIRIPDRELACAPANSPEAKDYFAAMSAACNYAWVNRQCINHWTREAFQKTFKSDPEKLGMRLVYDVAHNLAKREEHTYEGKTRTLFVHRKGATRAFPAGRPEIPQEYRNVGQPVIIPGSMGTASYLLVGGQKSLDLSWGSTAHGAGRFLSREAAIRKYWGSDVRRDLESRGIQLRAANIRVIAEEAPGAYKDVDRVADVSNQLGIATLVARMVPLGVTKG